MVRYWAHSRLRTTTVPRLQPSFASPVTAPGKLESRAELSMVSSAPERVQHESLSATSAAILEFSQDARGSRLQRSQSLGLRAPVLGNSSYPTLEFRSRPGPSLFYEDSILWQSLATRGTPLLPLPAEPYTIVQLSKQELIDETFPFDYDLPRQPEEGERWMLSPEPRSADDVGSDVDRLLQLPPLSKANDDVGASELRCLAEEDGFPQLFSEQLEVATPDAAPVAVDLHPPLDLTRAASSDPAWQGPPNLQPPVNLQPPPLENDALSRIPPGFLLSGDGVLHASPEPFGVDLPLDAPVELPVDHLLSEHSVDLSTELSSTIPDHASYHDLQTTPRPASQHPSPTTPPPLPADLASVQSHADFESLAGQAEPQLDAAQRERDLRFEAPQAQVEAELEHVPLPKHMRQRGHANFYSYRVSQFNLKATYAEQYEDAIRTFSLFTRTDLRATFANHREFADPQQSHKFARQFVTQIAREKGWLPPHELKLERRSKLVTGYRQWQEITRLRALIISAMKHERRRAHEVRLNSMVQFPIIIEGPAFDLLVGRPDSDESINGLAAAHGVKVKLRDKIKNAVEKRCIVVTGPYKKAMSFKSRLKNLMATVKKESLDLSIPARCTAADLTREILEPLFRTWQRSLDGAVHMGNLHVAVERASPSVAHVTLSSIHKALIPLALVAISHLLDLPRQVTPLYVSQDSLETRSAICQLEAEPDGRRRIRTILEQREEYEHVGKQSDLVCSTVLAPLSSIGCASGDDIYRPELQDAIEIGSVEKPMSVRKPRSAPIVRIEAKFGKFTFPPETPLQGVRAQVQDLAAALSRNRQFTPQTGRAVDRLKKEWLEKKTLLRVESFHRVQYLERSKLALPTSQRALVFEWRSTGAKLCLGRGRWTSFARRRRTAGLIRARQVEIRTVNVLFPRRNYDAVLTKSSSSRLSSRVIPSRLRRALQWRSSSVPGGEVAKRCIAAAPAYVHHLGRRYHLVKHEEVHRWVYLVEDEPADKQKRSRRQDKEQVVVQGAEKEEGNDQVGETGRKVVVERVSCFRTGNDYEHILLEADDPRSKQGEHPDAYLPQDMLKDVNHMLCMEDQSW